MTFETAKMIRTRLFGLIIYTAIEKNYDFDGLTGIFDFLKNQETSMQDSF